MNRRRFFTSLLGAVASVALAQKIALKPMPYLGTWIKGPCEILIYDHDLSDDVRLKVESYLANKYGIPMNQTA